MVKKIKEHKDIVIAIGLGLIITAVGMIGMTGLGIPSSAQAATTTATSGVAVSATVVETFTMTITGTTTGIVINGATTTVISEADGSAIVFGDLTAGVAKIAGQKIEVTTNAGSGFTVTVEQSGNLATSSVDIDSFKDGVASTTPVAWTSPAETGGQEDTYGHFGFLSDDPNITYSFSADTWVGFDGTDPFMVMTTSTPVTAMAMQVAYSIEVSSSQEGGTYSNTLTYTGTGSY